MLYINPKKLIDICVIGSAFVSASALGATLDAYHDDLNGLQALPTYIWFVLVFCSVLGAVASAFHRVISEIESLNDELEINHSTLLVYILGTVVLGLVGGVSGVMLGFAMNLAWFWVCLFALCGGFGGAKFIELVMNVVQGKAKIQIRGDDEKDN